MSEHRSPEMHRVAAALAVVRPFKKPVQLKSKILNSGSTLSYARYSTDEQKQSSIARQTERNDRYSTKTWGRKPDFHFKDEGISAGTVDDRPGLLGSIGLVKQHQIKNSDPQWAHTEGMKSYLTFIDKYMPGVDIADFNILYGYTQGMLLEHLIKQCGSDLSRENIIRQAKSLKNVVLPTLLPGISVNTSDKINMNYTQMRLQRWGGTAWELFGEVLDASSE